MLTLTPIAGFSAAFVLAFALTPFVRRLALHLGAVDAISHRKIHARDVPRLGGVAIALAFFVPLLVLGLRWNLFQQRLYQDPTRLVALFGGGLVILGLGVYDDLCGATAIKKLAVQVPVAMLAWWAGIRVGGTSEPSGGFMQFGAVMSLVLTTVWITGVVNAINLIDGLDGLASGIALQALAAIALCAWHRDEPVLALVALVLGGGVGGFLVHNFHPASVFMGDSGSMFIGYVIAVTSVWSAQKGATVVGVVLPAVALGLPLLDTSLAVWRRMATHRPIFSADLDHIHHRFLSIGWSHARTVLTLYGVGLFFSGLSVLLIYSDNRQLVWPVAVAAMAAALGLARWLGYLGPTGRGITPEAQRKNLVLRRALHLLERRLAVALTEDEISSAVTDFDESADEALGSSASENERALRVVAAQRAAKARSRRRL
jgi:UDP-GlcNAc:undecaprenyl-phosphate GlcNAc-1-phosphate transferase